MSSISYRQRVEEALIDLRSVQEDIFTSLVNIAMEGELKEWNETIEIGEKFKFNLDLFKHSDDPNIQILIKLIFHIDATYESIKNLNNIRD